MIPPEEISRVAGGLSKGQRHCLLRCSDAPLWDLSGRTFGRSWPDLTYGYSGAQYRSIKVLIRNGLVYEDGDAFPLSLYGLTPLGVAVRAHLKDQSS